jgi:response regulator NasT
MNQKLRIAVADDEGIMCEYLEQALPSLGHDVVAVARNGRELVERCRKLQPDLVITDIRMPDMDGIAAATEISSERLIPFILVSAFHDEELLNRAAKTSVLAYLIKPIKEANLRAAIGIARSRFEEFQMVRQEAADLRQTLEDRSLIERAKTILMKKLDLDEPSAFRRLQKTAMQKKKKLIEIAKTILAAEEILQASDAE